MRADLPKLLVDRPRHGSNFVQGIKTRMKFDPQQDWEDTDLPIRLGRRARHKTRHGAKAQGDFLSPLYRFLEKSVGRLWNNVYSEVCAVAPKHSLLGQHVHQHLNDYVRLEGMRSYSGFFIDEEGVLRYKPYSTRASRKEGLPYKVELCPTLFLELHKGFWFRVEYRKYSEDSKVLEQISKRQLSRKETLTLTEMLSQKQKGRHELNNPYVIREKTEYGDTYSYLDSLRCYKFHRLFSFSLKPVLQAPESNLGLPLKSFDFTQDFNGSNPKCTL